MTCWVYPDSVTIHDLAIIQQVKNIKFGKNIIIDPYVFIDAAKNIKIGSNVHISMFSMLTGGENIIIGDFVTISSHCNIMSGSDDFTSPKIGNPTTHESFREIKRGEINIGNFCRIGTESIIMPGVTIGEGAVVGANSVVTKNLDPFGIYIGNKKIGERNKKEIEKEYDNFLKFTI